MGASRNEVLLLVVRQGFVLIAVGVMLGLGLALVVGRFLASELYGINFYDPASFILAPLFLVAVAILASYLPARRTSTVDPVETLRTE